MGALIISIGSAWYTYTKNKDYIEVVVDEPMIKATGIYIYNEDRNSQRTHFKSAFYTLINVTNASNHNIGFFDCNLYHNDEKLFRLDPVKKDGTIYTFTKGNRPDTKIVISDKEDGDYGVVPERSNIKIKIAATNEDTQSVMQLDNVTLRVKFIKPSFWSFIPWISKRSKKYVEFEHTFTEETGDLTIDKDAKSLEYPIIKSL